MPLRRFPDAIYIEDSLPCTTKLKQEANAYRGAGGQEGMFCDSMQEFYGDLMGILERARSEAPVRRSCRMITAVWFEQAVLRENRIHLERVVVINLNSTMALLATESWPQ